MTRPIGLLMDDQRRCTAKAKSSGKRCKKAAVLGGTVCVSHGAGKRGTKQRDHFERRHEKEKAARAVATYGLPREVDPHDALLEEVHRTAGHVAWLGEIVTDLEQGDLVWGITKSGVERGEDVHLAEAAPNIWLELYHRERQHLVKVAKAAIDAGIDERRVRLAEEQGRVIVDVLKATLADLGVEVTPEVAAVAGRHLRAVS